MDRDLRGISAKGFKAFLEDNENALLSEAFWSVGLVQNLETSSVASPFLNIYLAAQIYMDERSLPSNSAKVVDLVSVAGDVHHIFPKEYLKQSGITDKSKYNQVANYAYLDTGVNISIGKREPADYFSAALAQCSTGVIKVGTITNTDEFLENLDTNCIPQENVEMTAQDYPEYLQKRRAMMAAKIRKYYYSL